MPQFPLQSLNLPDAVRKALDRKLKDRTQPLKVIAHWLAGKGYDVTVTPIRRYAVKTGLRPAKARHFLRVDQMLREEDRAAYEALLAQPRTRLQECFAWLKAHGYPHVGAHAVMTHRRRFRDKLEGVRQSARFAQAIVQVARESGQAAMSDGMLTRFEQVMLEQLMRLEEHEKVRVSDLTDMSKCVSAAVGSRERFEELRREHEQTKRRAAEEGERLGNSGASGKDVVERMKEILGV
jgi:hypothetical protein